MYMIDHKFQLGDQVWPHFNKEQLEGSIKKFKPIR